MARRKTMGYSLNRPLFYGLVFFLFSVVLYTGKLVGEFYTSTVQSKSVKLVNPHRPSQLVEREKELGLSELGYIPFIVIDKHTAGFFAIHDSDQDGRIEFVNVYDRKGKQIRRDTSKNVSVGIWNSYQKIFTESRGEPDEENFEKEEPAIKDEMHLIREVPTA